MIFSSAEKKISDVDMKEVRLLRAFVAVLRGEMRLYSLPLAVPVA